jgi:hypothetical protein
MLTWTGCVSLVLTLGVLDVGGFGADAEKVNLLPRRQDREPFVLDADDLAELRHDATLPVGTE